MIIPFLCSMIISRRYNMNHQRSPFNRLLRLCPALLLCTTAAASHFQQADQTFIIPHAILQTQVNLQTNLSVQGEGETLLDQKPSSEQSVMDDGDISVELLKGKTINELVDGNPDAEVSLLQLMERPIETRVPSFAIGHEDVYQRFIKGKLIFDNTKGQESKFLLDKFSEGEFNLRKLKTTFNDVSYTVSNHIRIKIGFRKQVEREAKLTIWLTPKFLLERQPDHPWNKVDWNSNDVGIFWTWGFYDIGSFEYQTSKNFNNKEYSPMKFKFLRDGYKVKLDQWKAVCVGGDDERDDFNGVLRWFSLHFS